MFLTIFFFFSLSFLQDYISKMDPASTLGLSTESVHGYSISHVKRVLDAEPPELPPCRRGVNNIAVSLKGPSALGVWPYGVKGGGKHQMVHPDSFSKNSVRSCSMKVPALQ